MKRIVMFGASGHAKVVWEAIKLTKQFELVGVQDPKLTVGDKWLNEIPVLTIEDAVRIGAGVIGIGENHIREKVANEILAKNKNFSFETIIHPKAIKSESSKIGKGTVVLAGVIVNADATIGDHVILNTGCVIEHDCDLADYSFVGPNAALGGNVHVDKSSVVGLGSSVKQGVRIGTNSILGMGGVLLIDLPSNQVAYGCPAKLSKSRTSNQNFFS